MHRRHVAFAALVLLLAATLAVGTGADTVTYDEVDTLDLQPAGDNAYVDENNGEIRIRVNDQAGVAGEGVNDNAVTDIGPVFTIENVFEFGNPSGDANRATVWVHPVENDGSDAVTFYNTDTGDPIETSEDGVELTPDEATTVGMRVDTTGDATPTITTLTVQASIGNLDFERIEYQPQGGETDLDVTREVTATAVAGSEELDVTEELTIEDSSDTIDVDDDKTVRTVNPEGGVPDSGWVDVSVGDREAERIGFDIDWRETDAMEGGSRASFQELGAFNRIEFEESVEGSVDVTVSEGRPSDAPDGTEVFQTVDIGVPTAITDTNATLVFTLQESSVTDPEDLTVLHETDGGYETLETSYTIEDGIITASADTSGFSAFVVTDGEPSSSVSTSGSSSSSLDVDDTDGSESTEDGTGDTDTGSDDGGSTEPDGDENGGAPSPNQGGAGADGTEAGGTEADGTGGETDGTPPSTDNSLFPTEIGGLTLSPPWFLLALAAASLLVVFAYRRR